MPVEHVDHISTDVTKPSGISHWFHKFHDWLIGNKIQSVVIAGESHMKGLQLGGLLLGDSIYLRSISIIRGYDNIGAGAKTYTVPQAKLWIVWGIYWYNGTRNYTANAYHGDVQLKRYDHVDRVGREVLHPTADGVASATNLLNARSMDIAGGATRLINKAPKDYLVALAGERIVITDETFQAGDAVQCWVHYTEIDWPYEFR